MHKLDLTQDQSDTQSSASTTESQHVAPIEVDMTTADSTNSTPTKTAHSTTHPVVDADSASDNNQPLLHSLEKPNMKQPTLKLMVIGVLIAVTAGVATGFGSYRLSNGSSLVPTADKTQIQKMVSKEIKTGDVFGSQDTSTFKDITQGYLETGGIDGEGSHKLLRPGGVSQTVYLTSSVIDLSRFEGMEIKIWGETFKGQQAGWLMDVGRVEVLNTQAKPPTE